MKSNIDLQLVEQDAAWLKIYCDDGVAQDLADLFQFYAPGYKYDPRFKRKLWDGKIRLFNPRTRLIYAGLKDCILEWAKKNNYTTDYESTCNALNPIGLQEWADQASPVFTVRDYQFELFYTAACYHRGIILSPTGSGKSFIIYLLQKYFQKKTLIVVPNINLIRQLTKDFEEYHVTSDIEIQQIKAGMSQDISKNIVISTWQSIFDNDEEWFDQFEMVICDECHGAKAKSLIKLMTNCKNAHLRFGFTGTMDDTAAHRFVLEGLFGPVIEGDRTKDLIDRGVLADVEIKVIVLEYPDDVRLKLKKDTALLDATQAYAFERDFTVGYEPRRHFIRNIANSLNGSTFVLCRLIDRHAKILFDEIKEVKEDCQLVTGQTKDEVREEARIGADTNDNLTVVASYGVFSTGVNVPNLRNIIFAEPFKAKIKVLQSIGRGLRKTTTKEKCTVIDIVDNLSVKKHYNYSMRHFGQRLQIYDKEGFHYKVIKIKMQ